MAAPAAAVPVTKAIGAGAAVREVAGPISTAAAKYFESEAKKEVARQETLARKVEARERAAADKMIAVTDRAAQMGMKRIEEADEVISALDRPFYRNYKRTKKGDITVELSVMSVIMMNAIASKWWAHMKNPIPEGQAAVWPFTGHTDRGLASTFYNDFMDMAKRSEEANYIRKLGDFITQAEEPFVAKEPGKPAPRGLGREFLDWIGWPKG